MRAALIPLLILGIVFLIIYWVASQYVINENIDEVHDLAHDELQRVVELQSSLLDRQLEAVVSSTELFRTRTFEVVHTAWVPDDEERARYKQLEDGRFLTTTGKEDDTAFIYSGFVPVGATEREKALRSGQLTPLMRSIQRTQHLADQLYFTTPDSSARVFPFLDVATAFPINMDLTGFNFYQDATAINNPTREPVWTDVYLDPAGKGWMTSCVAPVYTEDLLEGVCGIDVTVGTLNENVLNLDVPWGGYAVLLSQDGTLLALPDIGKTDWGLEALTDFSYEEYIFEDTYRPDRFNLYKRKGDFAPLASQVQQHPKGMADLSIGGRQRMASWATLDANGWKLLLIVPEQNLLAGIYSQASRLRHVGLLIIACLLGIYAVLFSLLRRRANTISGEIARPLEELEALAQRIGNGEYNQKPPLSQVAELHQMGAQLAKMGQRLGEANARTQDAQKQAETSRDEALKASQLKSAFLASVSHEIRTPLNGIVGMAELLEYTPLDEEQEDYVNIVRSCSQSLLDIVNDLLDLSSIEAGRLKLDTTELELPEVVSQALQVLKPRMREKGLAFSFSAPDDIGPLLGDPGRLRQVVHNLASNAVKFTEHGEVEVSIDWKPIDNDTGMARISVRDTGPGIDAASQKFLFRPFVMVDDTLTRKFGGTGLGLSISKQLVEAMGGEIGLDSEVGKGSIFWFRIPFTIAQHATPQPASNPTPRLNGTTKPQLRSIEEMTTPHETKSSMGAKVLIVDDKATNRKLMSTQLRQLGIEHDTAENGEKALQMLEQEFYPLILMDVQMPVLDGIQATKKVREEQRGKPERSSILAVTANAMAGDRENYIASGFDDFLSKPYSMDQLVKMLELWLQ